MKVYIPLEDHDATLGHVQTPLDIPNAKQMDPQKPISTYFPDPLPEGTHVIVGKQIEGEYKWLLGAIPAHCLLVERSLVGIKCKHETTGLESLKEMSLGRLHDAEWHPDFRVTTFCQIANDS